VPKKFFSDIEKQRQANDSAINKDNSGKSPLQETSDKKSVTDEQEAVLPKPMH
jgi:hypothetical protein